MIRVIKIGGAVVDSEEQLDAVLDCITRSTDPVILVHGGGRLATQLAEQLGIPQTMVNGRRITDADTLRIATMVYAGWINKSIVAKLQARGINAIGVSGADFNLIRSKKRDPEPVDFGYVGDVVAVDGELLGELLGEPSGEPLGELTGELAGELAGEHAGEHVGNPEAIKDAEGEASFRAERGTEEVSFRGDRGTGDVSFRAQRGTVVIAPITHDGSGTLLNTNADTIATEVAMALAPDVSLTFAFDHAGVLRDINDPTSVIGKLSRVDALKLIDVGVITAGMMPKLENAFKAAERGVQRVRVARYDALDSEGGTWIV